jgi:hypothetical protein
VNEIKIYIASKITGEEETYRDKFTAKEKELQEMGYIVMNPAVLPYPGFEHSEYMHICKAMIDVCDMILLFGNWKDSDGANQEFAYALQNGKGIWTDELTAITVKRLLEGGDTDASKRCRGLSENVTHES